MGKKGGKKAAEVVAAGAADLKPKSWQEALELDPAKKEQEDKIMAERQAKADAAAKAQQRANENREWREKERQKEVRKKDREDKQWQAEVTAAKAKAKQQGVLESEDWGDGTWWVNLGKGKWQEVQGQFFCTFCEKHLNDNTLKGHIESDAHQRKVKWGDTSCGGPSPVAAPAGPPRAAAAPAARPPSGAVCEEWQQLDTEGNLRCIPCGKVVDTNHLATSDHQRRLEDWLWQAQKAKSHYPAPALPYLADIPRDEQDPSQGRDTKCLLCNKWVQDDTSHTGTPNNPAGSKEHQKNLRNYPPGTPWYEANVTQVRNKWHPPKAAAAAPRPQPKAPTVAPWASAAAQAPPPRPPSEPQLPMDWFSAMDPKSRQLYYYNRAGQRSWHHPGLAAPAPSAVQAAAPPVPAKAAWGKAPAASPAAGASAGKAGYPTLAGGASGGAAPPRAPAAAPHQDDDSDGIEEC